MPMANFLHHLGWKSSAGLLLGVGSKGRKLVFHVTDPYEHWRPCGLMVWLNRRKIALTLLGIWLVEDSVGKARTLLKIQGTSFV